MRNGAIRTLQSVLPVLPFPGAAGAIMTSPSNNHIPSNWGPKFLNKGLFGNPQIVSPYVWHGQIAIGGQGDTGAAVAFLPNAFGVNDYQQGVAGHDPILDGAIAIQTINGRSYVVFTQPFDLYGSIVGGGGSEIAVLNGPSGTGSPIALNATLPGGTALPLAACAVGNVIQINTSSDALAAAITSPTQTAITVGGTAIQTGDLLQIDNEYMYVTAGGGTTSLTVSRGQLGTTATTHLNGAAVLDVEQMLITGGVGTTSLAVTRGYNSSRIAGHTSSKAVNLVCVTKANMPGLLFNGLRVRAVNSPAIAHATDPENDTSWNGGAGNTPGTRGIQVGVSGGCNASDASIKLCYAFSAVGTGVWQAYLTGGTAPDRFRIGNQQHVPDVVTFTGFSQNTFMTTLAAAITTKTQTAISVASGSGIANGDSIEIDSEIMLVTAGGGTTSLTVTRGTQ